MQKVEINNVNYAYKLHQQNKHLPYLLMLHGFMGSQQVFKHLIDELRSYCNPITIDLLGHGASSKPQQSARYNEDQQIEDLLRFIDQLNIAPPLLYGYSMGGRLALKTALTSPPSFSGLILESTNCGISDAAKRKERKKVDKQRAKMIEQDFQTFLANWSNLDLFQSPVAVDTDLQENYHQIQSRQTPSALTASLKGFGAGSMTPVCADLHKWNKPVLLLAGTADDKYQQINNNLVDQFPNATFSSIEAGHRVHLDNPLMLLNEITPFISNFN
ncbi:2-succinyl-6-hydroxy-2,4-cyclohexadiene-1-carboxylate synthase [Fodinibius halophilus]|uniref:2-succinyl-6-hydroxy-2,4-cyclohexadiene-1-carboxylate synthase n=1 Tax=Fodinibius halophilus TaxID=1736908 RepID=A0A6M1T0Y4_9BACT|nr:2-succinyl-6-hydroxy-2,4-cyclohexadiene-1-carboxylate synthase [Fodinibius halophilus]NGP86855.1 2-succinyl-6-hydroxy-2,4-cyclohexadiene-1-carboxylate synthase [Fodinibius halophilus]